MIHGEQVFTVAFLRYFKMSYLFVYLFIHFIFCYQTIVMVRGQTRRNISEVICVCVERNETMMSHTVHHEIETHFTP